MNNNNVRFAIIFTMALVLWFGSGMFKSSEATVSEGEAAVAYTRVQVVSFREQNVSVLRCRLQAKTKGQTGRLILLAQVSGKNFVNLSCRGKSS